MTDDEEFCESLSLWLYLLGLAFGEAPVIA
jgi:hypothetical protein